MGETLSSLECILKGEVRTSAGGLDMVCEDLPRPLIIFWNLYWMVVRASYSTHHFQFFFLLKLGVTLCLPRAGIIDVHNLARLNLSYFYLLDPVVAFSLIL